MEEVKRIVKFNESLRDDLLDGMFYANKGIYPPFHEDSDRDSPENTSFRNKFQNESWMTV